MKGKRELKYKLEFEGNFLGYFNTTPEAAKLAIQAGISPNDIDRLVFATVSTFNQVSYQQIRAAVAQAVALNAPVSEEKPKTTKTRRRKKKVETEPIEAKATEEKTTE